MNVQGQWQINQGNLPLQINIQPMRPDGSFVGGASYNNGSVTGAGVGYVHDGIFVFRRLWTNNAEGIYTGVQDGQGRLFGATFNVLNPSQTATGRVPRRSSLRRARIPSRTASLASAIQDLCHGVILLRYGGTMDVRKDARPQRRWSGTTQPLEWAS